LATEKRLLELRIQDLEHRLYGSSSEKLPIEDRQLALIDEVFDNPEPATTEDVVVAPDIEKRTAKKPVRRPLPERLEVVEERLEPADKTCSHCGREQCLVREESSERLDLIPARLIRRRTVRPVYACSACKDQSPVQVPMPPQVIDKGICGPGLLAHVVLAKYLEHRPLGASDGSGSRRSNSDRLVVGGCPTGRRGDLRLSEGSRSEWSRSDAEVVRGNFSK
jgi:transposase